LFFITISVGLIFVAHYLNDNDLTVKTNTCLSWLTAIILCLIANNIGKAQCPTTTLDPFSGNVIELTSQTDVDDFCTAPFGCTVLPFGVSLLIEDDNDGIDDITNLDGLSCLTSIGSELTIRRNDMLTDISDFSNLTSVGGDVVIRFHEILTDISGFSNLTTIGGDLDIGGVNNALIDISGFSNLTSVENLSISGNAALTDITNFPSLTNIGVSLVISFNAALTEIIGFSNITSIGAVTISDNATLTGITGFSNLTNIGLFTITDNSALTDLTGFSNLTSIGGGGMRIIDNGALTNLTGFSNLTSVGFVLSVIRNATLTDITGLSNVSSVGGALAIFENPLLSDCCALCALISEDEMDDSVIRGIIIVENNNTGCNNQVDIETCSPCTRQDESDDTVESIPTMGEWGLISLALLLCIFGMIAIREGRIEDGLFSSEN